MNNGEFDRIVDSIRGQQPSAEETQAAGERVRERLQHAAPANSLCAGFRAEFGAYRAGHLSEARKMLLDDHLHSCVACRREYSGVGAEVVMMPTRSAFSRRWVAVAVAAGLVAGLGLALPNVVDRAVGRILAPEGARGTVASIDGMLVAVSAQGATPLAVGAEIAEGQEIRTGKGSRAMVRLRDGSMVEMAERSALTLEERWRSKTVHLVRGNVVVEAAKQHNGRLEVATSDALVSVKGTIFGVSVGLKGSRVSVVEGAVQVDQTGGQSDLLHRGDQKTTHPSLARMAVTDDLAWSQNAAKYITMLADLQAVGEQISRLPLPGLRYSSRLIDRVPMSSVVVASMPNLSQVLGQATQIFDNRALQSADMAAWWNTSGGAGLRGAVDRVRTITDYLGDEILVTIPVHGAPVVLAEVKRQGLAEELARTGYDGPLSFEGSVVAIGAATVPPVGGFAASPFGAKILESYRAGVGLLFSANAEQIVGGDVGSSVAGFDNVRYFVAEQKGSLSAPVNTASLTFNGARHGVASWLAAPGPMGSLEFVSPQATFAASFVMRDPRQFLEELMGANGDASSVAEEFRTNAGVSLLDDLAGPLGGEATIAVDGAVLPTPAWKIAVEVDNADRLQWAIEQVIAAMQRSHPEHTVTLTNELVDGRKFYTLTGTPMAVHYTFVDGYWLMGANRAVLTTAISNRAAALTLPRSAEFRAQMPQDGSTYFSGLVYYNLGSTVGPIADELKASGLLTPQLQSQVDTLTANRTPSLIYMYGETDRIQVGSRSNLLQMGLQAIGSVASGNPMGAFPLHGLLPQ
ncbi:MAG: FecR family protein [Acidobacteriota bacterium]